MTNTVELFGLSHHYQPLSGGGEVLVLNTGAKIDPESQAMLAALHSRSPGGIRGHLKTLEKKGAENFMSSFYVGYGHKSIGDNGAVTVFIEGVSMLAAKAVQDFALYNGQEVSTRYVDFTNQRFVDPLGTPESHTILERMRTFYLKGLDRLIEILPGRFPRNEGESETVYTKAIKAYAFDVMRGFLPAGASTNLAWFGELRQFADQLPRLRHHPLQEVREIGEAVERALVGAHPSSFTHTRTGAHAPTLVRYEESERYYEEMQREFAYEYACQWPAKPELTNHLIRVRLPGYRTAMETRPPKTELPPQIRECGLLEVKFLLDFGSFRDLQRQRSVYIPMPLLTDEFGMEPWYFEELPKDLRQEAEDLLEDISEILVCRRDTIDTLGQYYIPMGYRVPIQMMGDLRAFVYVVELRASGTVHPTLRQRMHETADLMLAELKSSGLRLHLNPEPARFDINRGTHDIVEKEPAY